MVLKYLGVVATASGIGLLFLSFVTGSIVAGIAGSVSVLMGIVEAIVNNE